MDGVKTQSKKDRGRVEEKPKTPPPTGKSPGTRDIFDIMSEGAKKKAELIKQKTPPRS